MWLGACGGRGSVKSVRYLYDICTISLRDRYGICTISDRTSVVNRTLSFVRSYDIGYYIGYDIGRRIVRCRPSNRTISGMCITISRQFAASVITTRLRVRAGATADELGDRSEVWGAGDGWRMALEIAEIGAVSPLTIPTAHLRYRRRHVRYRTISSTVSVRYRS